MSYSDHHTDSIKNSERRIEEIEKDLVGASGSKKRKLKDQKKDHEKSIKKNRKAHDKHVKKEEKHDYKAEKYEDKMEANMVAYQNGIDPRANMLNAVGGIVSSVGTAGASLMGGISQIKGTTKGGGSSANSMFGGIEPDTKKMLGIGLLALLVLKFLFPSNLNYKTKRYA